MRVATMIHAYPALHNAGAEWMVHSMLRALVERGHRCEVTLTRRDERSTGVPYSLDGVRVHPYRSKHDAPGLIRQADLVITHLESTPRATVLARRAKTPIVHVLHNTMGRTKADLMNTVQGPVALGVVNSEWALADYKAAADELQKHLPPMFVLPPPVFSEDYATNPGGCVTLINLTKAKGAEIFYSLAKTFPSTRFLGVVGGYGDQIIRDGFPNVEIVPHTFGYDMRDKVYSRTKVLLMPSDYESYGRVGVEAMCSGIPVIAHPTPGLKESLGDAGIFADRGDINAWTTELRRTLDGRRWGALARRAIQRAVELDPTENLSRWCDIAERTALGVHH